MKKLSKIKLNQFSKDELDQRKMNALKGGCTCWTTCNCPCGTVGLPTIGSAQEGVNNPSYEVYTY
jgi:natural product precursor